MSPVSSAASATACGACRQPAASWTQRLDVPIPDLSSPGLPSATFRPRSMTAIRSASGRPRRGTGWSAGWCDPSATRSRIVSHIWPRVRGSRPVVGSSRKISGGLVIRLAARSRRRRMPPENCEMGRWAASVRPNCSSRSSRGAVGPLRGQSLQPAEQPEVLAARQVLVDRRVLTGDADELAHCVALVAHVVAEDPRLAAIDRQQRRQHLQHRGLAGAVRTEHAEDLTLHDGEVDRVHGVIRAEHLREVARLNGWDA